MSITPKRTLSYFLCFIGITFLLNLACSKDVESLREVVISKPTSPVVGQGESTDNQNKGLMEEVPQAGDSIVVETEIRTSVLYPINDAYLQNGKGYDEAIIRLEEEQRTSYLMFDFSPIDSIGGSITTATLMFVINTDDGSGEVEVYKGKSSDWSEENLNEKSAPDVGELVGATKQEYRINAEISIDLKVEELELEPSTFILDHKNGDDLAFASKEHESEVGSSLVVVYEVVAGSEDIASYLTQPKVIDRDSVNNEEEDVDVIEEEETDSEEEALVKEQVEEKKTDEEGEPEEGPVEEEATDSEENTTKSEEVEEENADGDEKKPEDEPDEAAADEQETGSEEDVPAEVKEESTDSTENEPEEKNNTDSIIDVLPNTPFPKNESPVAVVSGSPINGEAPLKVSFSAADSSDDKAIVSYLWDFKDGETASTVDVQHTFVKTGKYEVALVTKDEEGISASDIIIITVDEPGNNAPTAKLSVDKTSGTLPLSVNFTGSESTDDTSVSKYSWDFKDGNSSDKSNPSHTFESAGTYEVELTVTDAEGLINKETISITVESKENAAPVAKLSANKTSGTLPLAVNFTGSESTDDTSITGYSWDFKDGNSSDKSNPSHTFESAGTYDVELTVTDAEGLSNKETISITVESKENAAPVAKLSANKTSGTLPLAVNFTGSESTDDTSITGYSWDFKDGNSSDKSNPSHTFESAGTYDVELTVTDAEGLSNKETISITVESKENAAPVAKLSVDKTSGTLPLAVNFTGSESTDDTSITGYSWDFKDGNSSDKSNPSHTFESAGTYDVELTVTDAEGLSNKETISITVESKENAAPVAKLSANKTSGTLPLAVNFTGSESTDDTSITGYSWDFKDGNSSDKSNPSHTFETAGTYEVELTVKDSEGLSNNGMVSITVEAPANQPPSAKVSANMQSGDAPLSINFTGSSSNDDVGVTAYMWDFKDGSSSTNSNPSHTFESAGTYEVELTVADAGGLQNKETITINVETPVNTPPIAVVRANKLSGEAPFTVNFIGSDSSDDKGITRYDWNISGNYSTEVSPSHVFTAPGVYDVSLTVTDVEGLTHMTSLSVNVTEATTVGQLDCSIGGKTAGETGHKVWCWGDISFPSWSGSSGVSFSNKQLYVDSQCDEQQVSKSGNRLKFKVNPKSPNAGNWCSEDYNIRAEVRTEPWNVRHPKGTEEWFGWSYTFGNNYVIDKNNEWLFFQVHPGVSGKSPHTELMVNREGQYGGQAGEIYIINHVNYPDYIATGIVPRAGQTLDIVVHAVWGDNSNGELQVWINGQKFYDKQTKTIYDSHPWGGNAKWGIYKWPWRDGDKVQESIQQGASEIETYLGTVRMITRRPGDSDYGTDSYSLVAPN